jgi:hypothetical protein
MQSGANVSYLDTVHDIRERLQGLNAKLPAYQAKAAAPVDDAADVAVKDRALYRRSQQTTATMFQASLNAFSLCWETMTTDQQRHHLNEYIDCQYANKKGVTPAHLDAIRAFLHKDVLTTRKGNDRVKWNGYFIEHVPEVECKVKKVAAAAQAQAEGDEGASAALVAAHVSVAYKKVTGEATTKSKRLVPADASFHTLRAQVAREKARFYVTDREVGEEV